ncbi:tail fiber domain-containing protein [Actimicrobium sp. CCC2.4]|uniref:tail fiber domain-containing protein n=1 Tax=Actimicrobium sp. CCC2.4 TaxID=3048606 RepID=UPI002AC92688|nr:tail fiber domain-containing protein [Actimicrobium sp. CCC2.4]MEB0135321.1 tail fiber domain-containing protein [Actimicrobium sp. CCC2.4]WPX31110.1 tail fiber domain-containing protein [Actimicrobium sp. CCC2.4]
MKPPRLLVITTLLLALPAEAVRTNELVGSFKVAADLARRASQEMAVRQAANIITTVIASTPDPDGDAFPEPPAFLTGAGPAGGGLVPTGLGAPISDGYGGKLGYCAWDNGSITGSANRLNGSASDTGAVTFAVVSAGLDGVFNRSCAQIASGAVTTDDDFVVSYNTAQIRQGVGGTVYFGDPVADMTALGLLTSGIKDGELRLVKSDNTLWRWNTAGSNWTSASNTYTASNVLITGGTINGTAIGNVTPSSGSFTTLAASGGITGNLTGNVTGNLTGNVTGSVTGNAGTATRLAVARTIEMTGDGNWSVLFDGSGTATGALVLASTGVGAGSYGSNVSVPTFTVDAKGRLTAAANVVITPSLSSLTGAAAANTIGNGAYAQSWNWQLAGNTSAFSIGETAASSGGSGAQTLLNIGTLAGSTAVPLRVLSRGVEAFRVDSINPQIVANNGSAAAPSYTFTGDQSTGLYLLAAGQLAASVAGTRGLWISAGNTAIGSRALGNNTVGIDNAALGNGALFSNTTGSYNTASGASALQYNTTGGGNSAFGTNALNGNSTGYNNVAIGINSLLSNTTGINNVATGAVALRNNATGSYNSALGANALEGNTTGSSNTASGASALQYNTTGSQNSAFGVNALNSNTTGLYNTASGTSALQYNSTGNGNSAFGGNALISNSSGYDNVAIGANTLYSNTIGRYNVAVGRDALITNTTGVWNVANGAFALYSNNGTGNTATGNATLGKSVSGNYNTATGFGAGDTAFSYLSGSNSTFIGAGATIADNAQMASASNITLLGANTLASGLGALNLDAYMTAIGAGASVASVNTVVLGRTNDRTVIGATGDDLSGNKLQVTGGIQSKINSSGTGLNLVNTLGGAGSFIDIGAANYGYASNGYPATIRFVDSGYSSHITFRTKNSGASTNIDAERMRLTTDGKLLIGSSTDNGSGDLLQVAGGMTVSGGAKISVQNNQDGGNTRGIFLWDVADSAWGMYMGTSGAGKSLSGGIAPASLDGRIGYAVRMRAYASPNNSFLWENTSELALMSLSTDTGDLYTRGNISLAALKVAGLSPINTQGAHLQWNKNCCEGKTYLINQRGFGFGGISFGESTLTDVYTENMALSASGALTVVGSVTAPSFIGSGAGLTGLSATSITTGTLAVANGGTGLSTTPANGQLLIGNGSGYTLAGLTGTPSQITVTPGSGSITLSLPQDIATASSPTFAGLTLTGALGGTTATFTNVKTGDGTVGAPAFAFTAEPNTGLYRPAASQLAASVAGTRSLWISTGSVAVGRNALIANTGGSYNIAFGYETLLKNTDGVDNSASGAFALRKNTVGNFNTGTGKSALYENTIGSYNTSTGAYALFQNTSGSYNAANGSNALYSNTTGANNTAMGYAAGTPATLSTTGSYSTFVGANATVADTAQMASASYITLLGAGATASGITGASNQSVYMTAIGAGASVTTANTVVLGRTTSDVTVIGATGDDGTGATNRLQVTGGIKSTGTVTAATFSGSGSGLTALPAGVLSGTIPSAVLGASTVYIGTTAVALNRASGALALTGTSIDGNAGTVTTTLDAATNATRYVAFANASTGPQSLSLNTALTYNPSTDTLSAGNLKTGDGTVTAPAFAFTTETNTGLYRPAASQLAASVAGARGLWITTGSLGLGSGALASNTSVINNNVAVGQNALTANANGYENTASGSNTLVTNTDGYRNSASGAYALNKNTIGNSNSGTGAYALFQNTTGSYNAANGGYALRRNNTGASNTAMGYAAGNTTTQFITGNYSTFVGANATVADTAQMASASYITLLGAGATASGITGANDQLVYMTAIGAGASVTTANTVVLGRVGDSVAIGQTNSDGSYKFFVAGTAGGTSGFVNTSDARYKMNVTPVINAISTIKNLNGVHYEFNRAAFPEKNFENGRQLGFIAQQIEPFVPEVVRTDRDGYKGVQYSQLVPLLVEGIKEQQQILQHLIKKDPATLLVDIKTFQGNDAVFENIKSTNIKTANFEAETARIKKLEADRIDTKYLRSDVMKTGETEVFVSLGAFQPIFAPLADAQYIVNATAEDGSSAFASVAFMAGRITVTPISGKGVDVTTMGSQVGLVAASKKVKATWIRMS